MSSKKILKYNYEVLSIDTMYKTNKYKMPLIFFSRLTLLNNSYYIAFAFDWKLIFKVDNWILECIKDLYEYFNIFGPNVIFINT